LKTDVARKTSPILDQLVLHQAFTSLLNHCHLLYLVSVPVVLSLNMLHKTVPMFQFHKPNRRQLPFLDFQQELPKPPSSRRRMLSAYQPALSLQQKVYKHQQRLMPAPSMPN
jgi:hypothetical protein